MICDKKAFKALRAKMKEKLYGSVRRKRYEYKNKSDNTVQWRQEQQWEEKWFINNFSDSSAGFKKKKIWFLTLYASDVMFYICLYREWPPEIDFFLAFTEWTLSVNIKLQGHCHTHLLVYLLLPFSPPQKTHTPHRFSQRIHCCLSKVRYQPCPGGHHTQT